MSTILKNEVRRVNRTARLGLDADGVKKVVRRLKADNLSGNEIGLENTIVRTANALTDGGCISDGGRVKTASANGPRVVGRGPSLAHGFSCPRCGNSKLLSLNVATAGAQLPFCTSCRIAVVPAGDM